MGDVIQFPKRNFKTRWERLQKILKIIKGEGEEGSLGDKKIRDILKEVPK